MIRTKTIQRKTTLVGDDVLDVPKSKGIFVYNNGRFVNRPYNVFLYSVGAIHESPENEQILVCKNQPCKGVHCTSAVVVRFLSDDQWSPLLFITCIFPLDFPLKMYYDATNKSERRVSLPPGGRWQPQADGRSPRKKRLRDHNKRAPTFIFY